MTEIWKPVPGYEEWYKVSNHGRVMSFKRWPDGRLKKPSQIRSGYFTVGFTRRGITKTVYVHQVVAEAFIGPCPEGMQINHIDGDKANNRAENLEYVTPRENLKHAKDELGMPIWQTGEKHPLSKLTEKQVLEIRSKYPKGNITLRELAEKHGVSTATISSVLQRHSWTHI